MRVRAQGTDRDPGESLLADPKLAALRKRSDYVSEPGARRGHLGKVIMPRPVKVAYAFSMLTAQAFSSAVPDCGSMALMVRTLVGT